MESCVKDLLLKKGYTINDGAQTVINMCDSWYANRAIRGFHDRKTVQGVAYNLDRLPMAKRCCSDDANLCEVVEINTGKDAEKNKIINGILEKNKFDTQYRRQLEKVSASGTVACYVRLVKGTYYSDGTIKGGDIKLNYVDADNYIPLTVENDEVVEAAFASSNVVKGKKVVTLVLFTLNELGKYVSETHIFNEKGDEDETKFLSVILGDVKPFAVLRNAEVNNLDDMDGYGLPKIYGSIPVFKSIDLTYNVLYSDLDKAEKIVLVNELICEFDSNGKPILSPEQKKLFMFLGEKLPDQQNVIQEFNPEIRIDPITKAFELNLSLLSMSFGYGTKKYSFENGQITTATEYIGERQDQMQELNRQRKESIQYITDICRAIMWFSNTFHDKSFDIQEELTITFDDSYITDKNTELDRMRNDALSFDIPEILEWYLVAAYKLTEEEANKYVTSQNKSDPGNPNEDTAE